MNNSLREKIEVLQLEDILDKTTKVYRKRDILSMDNSGAIITNSSSVYPYTDEAPKDNNYEKVDMVFVDVTVDKNIAQNYRYKLESILIDYPNYQRLSNGMSYVELSSNLELNPEKTFRFMALGKVLGFWDIYSGKNSGLSDIQSLELAGMGLLNITGYRPLWDLR